MIDRIRPYQFMINAVPFNESAFIITQNPNKSYDQKPLIMVINYKCDDGITVCDIKQIQYSGYKQNVFYSDGVQYSGTNTQYVNSMWCQYINMVKER